MTMPNNHQMFKVDNSEVVDGNGWYIFIKGLHCSKCAFISNGSSCIRNIISKSLPLCVEIDNVGYDGIGPDEITSMNSGAYIKAFDYKDTEESFSMIELKVKEEASSAFYHGVGKDSNPYESEILRRLWTLAYNEASSLYYSNNSRNKKDGHSKNQREA